MASSRWSICPASGRNLQDHASTGIDVLLNRPIGFVNQLRVDRVARSLAQWAVTGTGALAGLPVTGMLFARSREGLGAARSAISDLTGAAVRQALVPGLAQTGRALSLASARCCCIPDSRGWIKLRSADPMAKPRITFNLLAEKSDYPPLRAAIRIARELVQSGPLAQVDRTRGGAGRRRSRPTTSSTPSSARTCAPRFIRSAPARWASAATRWSMPSSRCAASRVCAWSMPR